MNAAHSSGSAFTSTKFGVKSVKLPPEHVRNHLVLTGLPKCGKCLFVAPGRQQSAAGF